MSTVSGSTSVFVRNATGLVRELSPFDAFNLVFSAVLIPVGITQVLSFAPTFWPGANVLLSFLFSIPLVLCFGLVYLYFTVAMPRSGGDYVWVSRVLGRTGTFSRMVFRIASIPRASRSFASKGVLPVSNS